MNNSCTATYYDGKSSLPQQVQLFFKEHAVCFSFEGNDKSVHKWFLKEVVFETIGTVLQAQYTNQDTVAYVKITDHQFIEKVMSFRKNNGYVNWYEKLVTKSLKTHLFIAVSLLAIIALCYVFLVPWMGEKSVLLIPESYDDKLGNTFLIENTLLINSNDVKSKQLTFFARELQLNNNKKLQFKVVDEDVINAFALPNGTIVVYTGILEKMKTYEELVALLGHEAAHINQRHSMKMLCRNLSGYIFVSAILGDANGVMTVLGDNINTLQSLSFSRKFEKEADTEGFKIMMKNNVNPTGMTSLFNRLQEEGNTIIPEFLSSHPVTKERIKMTKDMVQKEKYKIKENLKLKRLFEDLKK